MKRALLSLCLVTVSALIAAPAAPAEVVTNQRETFASGSVACNGELVTGDVTLHLVSRSTTDRRGVGHIGHTITAFFRGISASGERYIGPSHQTAQVRGDVNANINHTETFSQKLIRAGEDGTPDDLHFRLVFHFTLNANGELTVNHLVFSTECK